MTKKKVKTIALSVLIIAVLFLVFAIKTSAIRNPTVLPDETAYINLIGKISKTWKFDAAQYPPFYPFMASLVYLNDDIISSYTNIRILNLFIFSLTFFPLFFIAKRILNLSNFQNALLCTALMIMPWSSFLTPLWAEPLYFLIFNVSVFLSLVSFQTQRTTSFFATGVCLGLLFLTKQAGIILAVGLTATLFFNLLIDPRKAHTFKNILAALFPFISIVLLYKFLSYSANGSPGIGYSNVVDAMTSRFFSLLTKYNFYKSFFHQFSYVTTATFFIFFSGMFFLFFQFKNLEHFKKLFLFFIGITLFGLMGFIAVFNNTVDLSYNDTNEPLLTYGRYMVALLPSIIILGFFGIDRFLHGHYSKKTMFGIFFVQFLLLGQYTPLHTAFASGIFGSPDTTYLCQLFNQNFPPWDRHIIENNLGGLPWTLALFFVFIALLYLFLFNKQIWLGLAVLIAMTGYTGSKNQIYARSMAGFLEDENTVYKKLVKLKIEKENIYILEGYNPGIYIAQFWYGFYDFAGWVKNNQVSKADVAQNSEKLRSLIGKYILMGDKDFKDIPAVFETNSTRLVLIESPR